MKIKFQIDELTLTQDVLSSLMSMDYDDLDEGDKPEAPDHVIDMAVALYRLSYVDQTRPLVVNLVPGNYPAPSSMMDLDQIVYPMIYSLLFYEVCFHLNKGT